jgi:peptide/nickel transport system permease protein
MTAQRPAGSARADAGPRLAGERRHDAVAGLAAFARAQPLGAACAVVLLLVLAIAVFAPVLAPYSPTEHHNKDRLVRPSRGYIFGTDQFGRDVFSRVLYGARTSAQVGLLSTAIVIVVATTLGVTTAYFGGPWDYLSGRVIDMIQALPGLVLLITLLAAFGRSLYSIALVLGLLVGVVGSRVIRGATLGVAAQPYVEVARSIGCSPLRIIVRYLLVNVFPVVIVVATLNIGGVIVAEASLSFLGYGVKPPAPSWGGMVGVEGRRYMVDAPWLFIAPTAALALVVFSVNMFGDTLRDRLDPRMRGGR